jgi:hypothetical protein
MIARCRARDLHFLHQQEPILQISLRQPRSRSFRHEAFMTERRDVLALGLSFLTAAIVAPRRAGAQSKSKYPERAIKLDIPFAPGGVTDVAGRLWADAMKGTPRPGLHRESGRRRFGRKRHSRARRTPRLPGMISQNFIGLFGPAGTPKAI